jgi:hypothetical protein
LILSRYSVIIILIRPQPLRKYIGAFGQVLLSLLGITHGRMGFRLINQLPPNLPCCRNSDKAVSLTGCGFSFLGNCVAWIYIYVVS